MSKIYYFLGNLETHVEHALPLYYRVGGTFVVFSAEVEKKLLKRDLPVLLIDEQPTTYLTIDRSVKKTIKYLNENASVIIFYDIFKFKFGLNLKKPTTIFLSHGNILKGYFWKWRTTALRKLDYVAGLSPIIKKELIEIHGLDSKKVLNLGIARNDCIVASSVKERNVALLKKLNIPKDKKVLAYVPTYWGVSTVDNIGIDFVERFPASHQLLLRLHPSTPQDIKNKYDNLVAQRSNIHFASNISLDALFNISHAIVGDLSSVMLDAVLVNKPLIFLYQKEKDYRVNLYSIKNIVEVSQCVSEASLDDLENIIGLAFKEGINKEIWESTKKSAFFDFEQDCVLKLESLIKLLE